MTITSIKPGDLVRCDRKGTIFYAEVVSKGEKGLHVTPITPHITYYSVTAREVKAHWRKSKASR